jgi:quinolinate synthase
MKKIKLEDVLQVLKKPRTKQKVKIPQNMLRKAKISVEKMMKIP